MNLEQLTEGMPELVEITGNAQKTDAVRWL